MAMEHANSFVEKFFEDDLFLKKVIELRGFEKYDEKDPDAENERIVRVANQMGFKFDVKEYETANKQYLDNLGGWEAMKKIFHIMKVASSIEKDSLKQ